MKIKVTELWAKIYEEWAKIKKPPPATDLDEFIQHYDSAFILIISKELFKNYKLDVPIHYQYIDINQTRVKQLLSARWDYMRKTGRYHFNENNATDKFCLELAKSLYESCDKNFKQNHSFYTLVAPTLKHSYDQINCIDMNDLQPSEFIITDDGTFIHLETMIKQWYNSSEYPRCKLKHTMRLTQNNKAKQLDKRDLLTTLELEYVTETNPYLKQLIGIAKKRTQVSEDPEVMLQFLYHGLYTSSVNVESTHVNDKIEEGDSGKDIAEVAKIFIESYEKNKDKYKKYGTKNIDYIIKQIKADKLHSHHKINNIAQTNYLMSKLNELNLTGAITQIYEQVNFLQTQDMKTHVQGMKKNIDKLVDDTTSNESFRRDIESYTIAANETIKRNTKSHTDDPSSKFVRAIVAGYILLQLIDRYNSEHSIQSILQNKEIYEEIHTNYPALAEKIKEYEEYNKPHSRPAKTAWLDEICHLIKSGYVLKITYKTNIKVYGNNESQNEDCKKKMEHLLNCLDDVQSKTLISKIGNIKETFKIEKTTNFCVSILAGKVERLLNSTTIDVSQYQEMLNATIDQSLYTAALENTKQAPQNSKQEASTIELLNLLEYIQKIEENDYCQTLTELFIQLNDQLNGTVDQYYGLKNGTIEQVNQAHKQLAVYDMFIQNLPENKSTKTLSQNIKQGTAAVESSKNLACHSVVAFKIAVELFAKKLKKPQSLNTAEKYQFILNTIKTKEKYRNKLTPDYSLSIIHELIRLIEDENWYSSTNIQEIKIFITTILNNVIQRVPDLEDLGGKILNIIDNNYCYDDQQFSMRKEGKRNTEIIEYIYISLIDKLNNGTQKNKLNILSKTKFVLRILYSLARFIQITTNNNTKQTAQNMFEEVASLANEDKIIQLSLHSFEQLPTEENSSPSKSNYDMVTNDITNIYRCMKTGKVTPNHEKNIKIILQIYITTIKHIIISENIKITQLTRKQFLNNIIKSTCKIIKDEYEKIRGIIDGAEILSNEIMSAYRPLHILIFYIIKLIPDYQLILSLSTINNMLLLDTLKIKHAFTNKPYFTSILHRHADILIIQQPSSSQKQFQLELSTLMNKHIYLHEEIIRRILKNCTRNIFNRILDEPIFKLLAHIQLAPMNSHKFNIDIIISDLINYLNNLHMTHLKAILSTKTPLEIISKIRELFEHKYNINYIPQYNSAKLIFVLNGAIADTYSYCSSNSFPDEIIMKMNSLRKTLYAIYSNTIQYSLKHKITLPSILDQIIGTAGRGVVLINSARKKYAPSTSFSETYTRYSGELNLITYQKRIVEQTELTPDDRVKYLLETASINKDDLFYPVVATLREYKVYACVCNKNINLQRKPMTQDIINTIQSINLNYIAICLIAIDKKRNDLSSTLAAILRTLFNQTELKPTNLRAKHINNNKMVKTSISLKHKDEIYKFDIIFNCKTISFFNQYPFAFILLMSTIKYIEANTKNFQHGLSTRASLYGMTLALATQINILALSGTLLEGEIQKKISENIQGYTSEQLIQCITKEYLKSSNPNKQLSRANIYLNIANNEIFKQMGVTIKPNFLQDINKKVFNNTLHADNNSRTTGNCITH